MALLQEFSRSSPIRPSIRVPLKELFGQVHGFFIQFDQKGITSIDNVTQESALGKPWYHVSDGVGLFWLLKDERVVYVAYCGGGGGKRITAIRFQTNMRSSQWFGTPVGLQHECAAKEGCFIHSICPQRLGWYYSVLEAVVLPVTASGQVLVQYRDVSVLSSFRDSENEEDAFRSCTTTVRAVLIDSSAVSATALSTEQYERYGALRDHVQLDSYHHIEELVPGEKMIRVDLTTERTTLRGDDEGECAVLSAMRLVTTHRTTTWFGNPRDNEYVSVTSGDEDGSYICGFKSTASTSGKTVAFGVVIVTPVTQ